MADHASKASPAQKEYSSHSNDLEHMYPQPTPATSPGNHPSSSVLAIGPAHSESAVIGGRISERSPSTAPTPASQPGSVSHSEPVSQPEDHSGLGLYVGNSPPRPLPSVSMPADEDNAARGHGDGDNTAGGCRDEGSGASGHHNEDDGATGNGSQTSLNKKKCVKCLKIFCALVSFGFIILGIIAFVMRGVLNEKELKTKSYLADLRSNDTILLYQGNSSRLTISEVLPVVQKPDVSLFVTECADLIQHRKNRSLTHFPLHITSSSPFFIPSDPLHYELGSNIMFTIRINDASEDSTLTLLMFDNATKANKYSQSPNADTGAQAIRHWSIDTKEKENSTSITFMPSYGSYYILVFSPVPSPILDIEVSYKIKQVFYFHGDYTQYTNCSLSMERCSLHFSTGNETCVLAYTLPSSEKVTLETCAIEGKVHVHDVSRMLSLIGGIVSIVLALAVLLILLCLFVCMYMYKRCRKKDRPDDAQPLLSQPPEEQLSEEQ